MTECPVVETSLGKAKGRVVSKVKGGKDLFVYTSLPFAKPPVGELRFELPVSPDPWDGLLDATEHSPSPPQHTGIMDDIIEKFPGIAQRAPISYSEDCLYLSVYTTNPSNTANLPVLFWIYGGGFAVGGEFFYDTSTLASLHDVVVVVPNYRLNVFGFLSLGEDTDYPGNVGLFDQNMAMKWTRDHIRAFGGNPDNVTIFGESAGSMSVNYHVVSPMSKGLFHQAISHSGSVYMGGFPGTSGPAPLLALAEELKLDEKDPEKLVKILKTLPVDDLTKAIGPLTEKMLFFKAVVDGKFIPKDPSALRKEPVASNVPYIVGVNNTEGFGVMVLQFPKDFNQGISKEVCNETLKGFIGGSICTGLPDSGFDIIKDEYLKGKTEDDKTKWSKVYGEVLADTMFVVPAIKTAQHHVGYTTFSNYWEDGPQLLEGLYPSILPANYRYERNTYLELLRYDVTTLRKKNKGTTYMYVMTQRPRYNHDLAYGPETAMKASFCECDHSDDVIFTFGLPVSDKKLTLDIKFTDDEKALSIEWMKYIVNFAKNGDPNIGLPVKTKWPLYSAKDQQYLSVQQPCTTGKNYAEEKFQFWEEVIQPMRNKPTIEQKQN